MATTTKRVPFQGTAEQQGKLLEMIAAHKDQPGQPAKKGGTLPMSFCEPRSCCLDLSS
mgnify:CR=1 FL=1